MEGSNKAEFTINQSGVQTPLVGQVLDGKYRIEYQISQGGFGIVYCATHIGLEKPRAVKVLRQLSQDRQRRFELEARALAELNHPYIVAVVDVGTTEGGKPYLVMEFVEGKSLGDIITFEGSLSLPRTLQIMRCVCSAVHYAHEQGIIHRDLKPGNIIVQRLSGEGEIAKVLDFGLAKFTERSAAEGQVNPITESGMILGTVEYLSPEQCAGQPTDTRSDVYALGVLLYQMLTGVVPFTGNTPFAILTQHVNAPPPRLRDACSELPASVEQVVCRAMAKDPTKRQQTALELRRELERAVLHPGPTQVEETEKISATSTPATRGVLPNWHRRLANAKLPLVLAALLLVASSSLYFYVSKPGPWVITDPGGWRESFDLTPTGRPNPSRWDAPPTWRIVPGEEGAGDGALWVEGPRLGTLHPPRGRALYDFSLRAKVILARGNKIAWALRVQGPNEYYLFELTFPESELGSAQLTGSVSSPAYPRPRPFGKETITDFGPARPGDIYWIELRADEYAFDYKLSRERGDDVSGSWLVHLESDQLDPKYRYGTIGFGNLPPDGTIEIEYVHIGPVVPRNSPEHQ